MMDSLAELFKLQTELNDQVFQKRGIKSDINTPMYIGELQTAVDFLQNGNPGQPERLKLSRFINHWVKEYSWALNDEMRELDELTIKKFWSSDVIDLEHMRKEIIDVLHFWISLALTTGMDAEMVVRMYKEKNAINLKRTENQYSEKDKVGMTNAERSDYVGVQPGEQS